MVARTRIWRVRRDERCDRSHTITELPARAGGGQSDRYLGAIPSRRSRPGPPDPLGIGAKEKPGAGPGHNIDPDRAQLARYGLMVGDLQNLIAMALGAEPVTTTVEGRSAAQGA